MKAKCLIAQRYTRVVFIAWSVLRPPASGTVHHFIVWRVKKRKERRKEKRGEKESEINKFKKWGKKGKKRKKR